MFATMHKLYPRSAANRGVCVDIDGAILGPDCILVERIQKGYRVVPRSVARDAQDLCLKHADDPDWLYQQSQRIAAALNRGEIALAQIYGLHIPIGVLDDRQLKRLATIPSLTKAGFNPDEPRIPTGEPGGGEWTTGGYAPGVNDGSADTAPMSALRYVGELDASPAIALVGGRWPAPAGANANPLALSGASRGR